jgi:hypothetical protein
MTAPLLSVVVAVVDGGETLRRCLTALVEQQEAPSMEILVPCDATVQSAATIVADVAARASARGVAHLKVLDLGRLTTDRPSSGPRGQHELIDRRRSAGLAAAAGELVALVEDRGVPRSDWAATIVRLHGSLQYPAIGGAVENGRDRLLNWAVYFCDFGRYQRPFTAGPRRYLSDVNVSYKRRALDATRAIWSNRYHEPLVHWELERQGAVLYASPDIVVDQLRDNLTVAGLLVERLAWGRLFGALRARRITPARRLLFVGLSPLVPALLFFRVLRDQSAKGMVLRRALAVSPALLLLLSAWAAGEAIGCLLGRA